MRHFVSRNKYYRTNADTQTSNILERANSQSDDDYVTLAMKPIYRDALQIKGRGGPLKRAEFVESAVTKRSGVWTQVLDAIEAAFDKLFERAENVMVKTFGDVFDTLHNNFLLLCDDSEAKDEKAKVLEKLLRGDLKEKAAEVKAMLEEGGKITKLVAQCKAYQTSQAAAAKDFSSMFVSQ
jgi:hypothetical protein